MNLTKCWHIVFVLAAGGLLTLAAVMLATRPGRAAGPWYVAPGGNDGNDCLSPAAPCATINGAIGKASPGDTIYVAIGTYTGTGDEVVLLNKNGTFSGGWDPSFTTQSGTSTIDGEGVRRGMTVNSGVTAIVEHFTVYNGSAEDGAGIRNEGTLTLSSGAVNGNTGSGSHSCGGGIINHLSGSLTLNSSTVSGNTATTGAGILNSAGSTLTLTESIVNDNTAYETYTCGDGGGINNGGTLILSNSTVSGNTARDIHTCSGGGIYNTGTAAVNNSTVSGNTAGSGSGIYNDSGTLTVNSSTVSSNTATTGGGVGSYLWAGSLTLQNTVVAGNAASNTSPDCEGRIGSSGYNLIGDTSGCTFTPAAGDLIDVDARLFPLIGSPGYHPLSSVSPAIDAGNPAGCTDHAGNLLDSDQRGVPRVGRCDIGSYEFDPNDNPLTSIHLPIVIRNE